MLREKVDVLVIGAGPAGTVAASLVNKNGFSCKIVEKQKFPRFVIGESLLPRCMEHLEEAGFLEALKAQGFQEKFGAKFVRGNQVCDFNFSDQFSNGWNWTWQVPRGKFDQVLATEVANQGVPVEFEMGVTDIKFFGTDSITTVEDHAGNKKEIEAKFIIDASGYGRVIPRLFNLDKPSNFDPRKTLFTHIKDTNRPEGIDGNRITVVIHQPRTWIWVIPFSTGITSVGFVGDPSFFEGLNGTEEEKLRAIIESDPIIAKRFRGCEFDFEPRIIEGYAISAKKLFGDGFVLTGNSSEFLDPIFSSGVTFAMESGSKAGKLVSKFLKGETVDWEKDFVEHMMQGINTFRSYVAAWYEGHLQEIFFAPNPDPTYKKQICSVLAGYVWDLENPFVRKHTRAIKSLADVIRLERQEQPS
ncbi:MAG TPA: NAD(P)/FAD-dependent oxidoreductase [Cytophagaceae bacterium]|jgi:flavin-dependent dehydrogenase|nr:NAD(P)/FAD-dependent oxidoreductase [Cytophagaceae bacterium]